MNEYISAESPNYLLDKLAGGEPIYHHEVIRVTRKLAPFMPVSLIG